ncbi:MAG: calcium/sodium antiporter [Muribaculaceae bacterium]
MDYLFLALGLILLLSGANVLVDSTVAIAKKANISDFVIGFTIIGMGTSAPELFISFSSAITGHGDMAMGNVIGSNICNVLLILGATATILPFAIERQQTRRDIPFAILTSVMLTALACDKLIYGGTDGISRIDGAMLLLFFVAYMYYVITHSRNSNEPAEPSEPSKYQRLATPWLVLIALAALAALLGGGTMFLDSAKAIARAWGMSETVISITIVALGTSLPELITCVIAATRGNTQLALGNVLGSNIFNVLLVLGLPALVCPISTSSVHIVDYQVLIASALLCYVVVFTFGKRRFDRIEGIIFLLLYLAYDIYLFLR